MNKRIKGFLNYNEYDSVNINVQSLDMKLKRWAVLPTYLKYINDFRKKHSIVNIINFRFLKHSKSYNL